MSEIGRPNLAKSIIHSVLDFLFPRRCFGCLKEGQRLCADCLSTLPRHWDSNNDEIISVFDYRAPAMKQAIWALKYKRALDLAETFAWPLHEALLAELAEKLTWPASKIILIPVPLAPRRLRQRGYNQALILAKQLKALDSDKFEILDNWCLKIKNTPSQVSLKNRSARLANLTGAFALKSPKIIPPDNLIIILDDVASTGATINEIRRVLQPFSQRQIYGLTLARG